MAAHAALDLTREQILAFRRHVGALDSRLPPGARSIRRAAEAGLQDSMPRAAVLSLHARVEDMTPDAWAHPSLVQVWGPRYSAYAVPARDRAAFTVGRLPDDEAGRRRAVETADRLEAFLDGRRMTYGDAGRGLGVHPNSLRYAAPTGRVLIRWEGARQPLVWTVEAPEVTPEDARLGLVRRYLHVFGPSTPQAFAQWAGIRPRAAAAAFRTLTRSLVPVRTPIGEAWALVADEEHFRTLDTRAATARLLPSGDVHTLLQGRDRELLVPDEARRRELWTPRVWPGAVLVAGEVAGIWRRAGGRLDVDVWHSLTPGQREALDAEAASFPLPAAPGTGRVEAVVRWTSR